jgi:hypothetical protein
MKYQVNLPGFEAQQLTIDVRFPLRPRIIANKKAVKSNTGKWNQLAMRRDDGLTSIVHIKPQFPDPVPQLEMDEEIYKVVKPFTWGQRIFAMLPLILIIFAVMDPALAIWAIVLALLSTYLNFWILRLQEQALERNLMIFTITVAAAAIFFIIRFLVIRAQLGM